MSLPYLSVDEAASQAGLTVDQLMRLVEAGRLPMYRINTVATLRNVGGAEEPARPPLWFAKVVMHGSPTKLAAGLPELPLTYPDAKDGKHWLTLEEELEILNGPLDPDTYLSYEGVELVLAAKSDALDARAKPEIYAVKPDELADALSSPRSPEGEEVDPRERATMLRVIRALLKAANVPERGGATVVEKQLEMLGFNGPKEAAIRDLLRQAFALKPDKPQ